MKRAMDGDSIKLALDHATEMLRELRVSSIISRKCILHLNYLYAFLDKSPYPQKLLFSVYENFG